MDKKVERIYNIDLFGLKLGSHQFQFSFDDRIFETDGEPIVEKGSGICEVTLDKAETLITLWFEIKGEVELVCDRSTEVYMHSLDLKERLILKYGEEFDDSNDEVWIIPQGIQQLNVMRNIAEFINVAIPMKRLHPKFGEDDAEGMELIYTSDLEEDEVEQTTDPRWAALQQLKDLKN